MKRTNIRNFWIRDMPSGETEYRARSKVLFTILPVLLAALLYKLLIVIDGLERGGDIIMILGIGLSVLMATMILLVLIVSLIEYLRTFE